MRRWVELLRNEQSGVSMVEATIGICLLLLMTMGALQIVLTLEASLEAHTVAARMARAYAITGDLGEANRVYAQETTNTLGQLAWTPGGCTKTGNGSTCSVSVKVPELLPGAGLFIGSSGSALNITIDRTGFYPNFERAN